MIFDAPLTEAIFLKRYKRFLADFRLENGNILTAHCANTGSMLTCMSSGALAWLTFHDDPKRKLKYSWQAIRMPDGWVGINTGLANRLVKEAILNGTIRELQGYAQIKPEQKYGKGSRIDLLLRGDGRPDCYVEVKNVTLLLHEGVVAFPDAVTRRGTKHLLELIEVRRRGGRAVLLYCVQRESARKVVPAETHDPDYARTLREAVAAGVEVYGYRAVFKKTGIALESRLPLELE